MRIGLLADVHANLPALRAVLAHLDRSGVEQVLVAGDLVGYGGQPNECVAALVEVGARCVAGNHDLFVLDRLPPTRFPDLARRSAEVTRSLLTSDTRDVLGSLPERLQVGDALVTHGSLDSPEEYVTGPARARELLARLPGEAPGARTLVLGHTHRQWCVLAGRGVVPASGTVTLTGVRLLNPGGVGQSRERERQPRARFAVYDSTAGQVQFLAIEYDVDAARAPLRALGLPDRCLHARPSLRRQLLRTVRPLVPEALMARRAGRSTRR